MKYVGSKARIVKDILPIILGDRRDSTMFYDVCCGGGSMVSAATGRRTAVDVNPFAIEALRLIRDNPESLPRNNTEFDEDDYKELKRTKTPTGLAGVLGFAASWGAKWFGGWARCAGAQDYIASAYNAATQQSPNLQGVELIIGAYNSIEYEPNSIIYCDPPYSGTQGYAGTEPFDHGLFWQWVRDMTAAGQRVFVSEYNAPADFAVVWSRLIVNNLNDKTATECLFTLNPRTAGMLF